MVARKLLAELSKAHAQVDAVMQNGMILDGRPIVATSGRMNKFNQMREQRTKALTDACEFLKQTGNWPIHAVSLAGDHYVLNEIGILSAISALEQVTDDSAPEDLDAAYRARLKAHYAELAEGIVK